MAQTIKLKRSATTGNVPTTSQLALGELGINTTDGKLFLKKSVSGTESIVEVGSTGSFLPLSGGSLSGNLSLGDNVKAQFGSPSNDLQIYHDGSNSYINDTGTGALFLKTNYLAIAGANGNQLINAEQGGAIELYHANAKILETKATGADISGVLTADGLTVDGAASIGSSTAKTKFYSDSTYNGIYNGSSLTSDESIYMGADSMFFYASGKRRLDIKADGDISFRDSAGTSETFYWDSSTSRLGLGTTVPAVPLHVIGDIATTTRVASDTINGYTGGSTPLTIQTGGTQNVVLGTNNATALTLDTSQNATFSGSVTSTGNVSVGGSAYTTSADLNLLGDGLAIKNDKAGSSNNWSYIQNTDTGSASNLSFTTGLGVALTLNHNKSASFGANLNIPNGGLMVGSTTAPSQALEIKRSGNSGNVALKIHNTGTATNDDALIGFLTEGNRNYSIGIHRGSGSFTLSNQDASVASGELLTIANSGAATFSGSVSATTNMVIGNGTHNELPLSFNSSSQDFSIGANGNFFMIAAHLSDLDSNQFLTVSNAGNVNIPNGGLMVGSTTAPEGQLTLQNDDASLRIRSNTTTTKGLTLKYNHAGNFGQLLVDHQGNNQLDMKYYALSHTFGRSDSLQFMTINSSGNATFNSLVGINKAVNSAVGLSVGSDANTSTSYGLEVCDSSNQTRFVVDGLGSQRFYGSDNSETARFTDGDLLVGTTDANVGTNSSGSGINLKASGEVQIALDSGEALLLNRMGTDGRIINFRKSGAFVGGVGVVGGDDLYIAGTATGLRFDSGVGKIYPTSGSGNVNDNTVDIGETNYRFKDLYLAGTANSGRAHIKTASSGASADVSADELVVESNGNAGISILSGQSNSGSIYFGDAGVNYDGYIAYAQATRSMTFGTAAGSRMTIDSSGNILANQSSTSSPGFGNTTTGLCFSDSGRVFSSASGAGSSFNRNSSDGDIIQFRKNGAIKGAIGTDATHPDGSEYSGATLYIGAGDAGLGFTDSGDFIYPYDVDSNIPTDGTITLGHSSKRFKDLYLSGKVTAANIYNAAGSQVMDLSNADSTIINDPEGVSGLYIGDSGQPDNYYSNTTHTFTGRNLTDIHAIIDTTGIKSLGDYKVGSTTVIDSSRNLDNIGTISSGRITSTGGLFVNAPSGNPDITLKTGGAGNNPLIRIQAATNYWDIQTLFSNTDDELDFRYNGSSKLEIDKNGNTVIAGTISSGAITSTGDISANSGKVRMGNPTLLSGRSSIRIDTSGGAADLVFGDNVTSTSWTNANWAISSRAASDSNSLRIYRGSGQPSPYNSEHVLMEFKQNETVSVNSTLQINNTTVIDASRNLTNIVNASTSKLTLVANTAANFEITASGTGTSTLYFNMTGGSQAASLSNSGNLIIAGSLTEVSDRRVKDNIAPIPDALSKTCALQGSTYTRTDAGQDTTKVHAGLIAQDVEAVLPEAIGEKEDMKTVNYSSVVALLVESIKELKSEVDDLKTQLSQKEK